MFFGNDGLGVVYPHIEPHDGNIAIFGQEFPDLGYHLFLPIGIIVFGTKGIYFIGVVPSVRMLPILPMRVVESQFQAMFFTGLGKFPDDIPLGVAVIGNVILDML